MLFFFANHWPARLIIGDIENEPDNSSDFDKIKVSVRRTCTFRASLYKLAINVEPMLNIVGSCFIVSIIWPCVQNITLALHVCWHQFIAQSPDQHRRQIRTESLANIVSLWRSDATQLDRTCNVYSKYNKSELAIKTLKYVATHEGDKDKRKPEKIRTIQKTLKQRVIFTKFLLLDTLTSALPPYGESANCRSLRSIAKLF